MKVILSVLDEGYSRKVSKLDIYVFNICLILFYFVLFIVLPVFHLFTTSSYLFGVFKLFVVQCNVLNVRTTHNPI